MKAFKPLSHVLTILAFLFTTSLIVCAQDEPTHSDDFQSRDAELLKMRLQLRRDAEEAISERTEMTRLQTSLSQQNATLKDLSARLKQMEQDYNSLRRQYQDSVNADRRQNQRANETTSRNREIESQIATLERKLARGPSNVGDDLEREDWEYNIRSQIERLKNSRSRQPQRKTVPQESQRTKNLASRIRSISTSSQQAQRDYRTRQTQAATLQRDINQKKTDVAQRSRNLARNLEELRTMNEFNKSTSIAEGSGNEEAGDDNIVQRVEGSGEPDRDPETGKILLRRETEDQASQLKSGDDNRYRFVDPGNKKYRAFDEQNGIDKIFDNEHKARQYMHQQNTDPDLNIKVEPVKKNVVPTE